MTEGLWNLAIFYWPLESGRLSPFYYNQRKITSLSTKVGMPITKQRELRNLAVEAYSVAIDDLDQPYKHLYGIPQSLTALGGMVAYLRGDSVLWGRVGSKEYGEHAQIEGDFERGDVVLDLDDTIVSARSKDRAAESLGEAGLDCAGFVIMFDREEGGAETVRQNGYPLLAVLGLSKTMQILRTNYRIGSRESEWIAQYHEQLRASGEIS